MAVKHKLWGAKKIHQLLYNDFAAELIPTVLTVHNILKKHGLVKPQKRLGRIKHIYPIFDLKACNKFWSAGYKAIFRTCTTGTLSKDNFLNHVFSK